MSKIIVDEIQKTSGTALTWPSADGSADQFMQTDGSGTLSFADVDTAQIADNAVTGAAEAVNQWQVPKFLGFSYVLIEGLEPKLFHGPAPADFFRVAITDTVGANTLVGGVVSEERNQHENHGATNYSDGPEGGSPAHVLQQESHGRGYRR